MAEEKDLNNDDILFQKFQERIAMNIITDSTIVSPYNVDDKPTIPLVYCDHTASNKPLYSVEDYVSKHCLGLYGNTHTPTSTTGSQSTSFLREARQVVAETVQASVTAKGSRKDVVLFTPQGTTGAIQVLHDCLGLQYYQQQKLLVLVGPYEHHSNLIPWRELGSTIATVEIIPENPNGEIDLDYLQRRLHQAVESENYATIIGSFSAASNVTGQVCPVQELTDLLHQYNALAVFDYATAASYGFPSSATNFDAMIWSPHKVLGGSQCGIGVLIMKQELVNNVNPPTHRNGGGTVFYVTEEHHRFLSKREERYEGGSPNVMGIVRLGLSLLYKRELEQEYHKMTSESLWDGAIRRHTQVIEHIELHASSNLILLGNIRRKCLPIFSFLIRHRQRFLHYNFVSAVLNDVFGIQCRGGCQCAGPYSQAILGLSAEDSKQIEQALLVDKDELLRPGYTRLSLPICGLAQCEVDYVQEALIWISKNAWALMCDYRMNHRTGEWHHYQRSSVLGNERRWLSHFSSSTTTEEEEPAPVLLRQNDSMEKVQERLRQNLQRADVIYERAIANKVQIKQSLQIHIPQQELRWFVHPQEVAQELLSSHDGNDTNDDVLTPPLGPICPLNMIIKSNDDDTKQGKDSSNNHDSNQPIIIPYYDQQQQIFQFRDGEYHSGEATLEDIQMGMDDGELSTKCLVYFSDSWMSVDQVCNEMKKNDADNSQVEVKIVDDDSKREEQEETVVVSALRSETNNTITSSSSTPQMFQFRDGEYHNGEATLEDIQMGIDDGELSSNCQVYCSDSWVAFEDVVVAQQQERENSIEDDRVVVSSSTNTTPDESSLQRRLYSFRDNTSEGGEAALEEIQVRIDRGDVASDCLVQIAGTWMTLAQARTVDKWLTLAQQQQQQRNATKITKMEEAATTPSSAPQTIIQPSENNNNNLLDQSSTSVAAPVKKGIRSCTEWGTGTPTILPTNNSNDKTTKGAAGNNKNTKKKKYPHVKPPQKMMRLLYQAIYCFEMLADGDRLLLGLSGGKDSLSLLHGLLELQRQLPIKFELHVCTIDPQMKDSFDPSSLKEYMATTFPKVPYHYMESDILSRATTNNPTSLCSFCARMKRGILYATARQHGCNKLVLAQHLDDAAETFMMTLLHNGMLRTMKANYAIQDVEAEGLSVIRPLIFCRERDMTNFAQQHLQPYLINENCPACFEEPKERARMKKLLHREESLFPHFYDNIRTALIPLMHDDMTAILRSYSDDIHAKGKKENNPIYQQRRRQQQGQEENNGDDDKTNNDDDNKEQQQQLVAEGLSDEILLRELARRKANQYRLVGAMKSRGSSSKDNAQEQQQEREENGACTKDGANGTIRCYELME